ncbi:MAG: hypothetical protein WA584_16715 [Pyrinomonadaceae bacterium]
MQKTNKTLLMMALLGSAMAFGTLSITGQTSSKSKIKIKIKTITGYFCGDGYSGQVIAHKFLRTTQGVLEFAYLFNSGVNNQWGEPTSFFGFKKKGSNKIGAEYVVKYVTNEDGEYDTQSFTFTGKTKKIKPCSSE